ncbi:p-loop containing nucleoside triphosphate hydrolase protein [Mycena venus]|uniref:p-loop containing nucleoside triphosphate hydrolase protein n=1 Tax=Mycena venus TaxID=2733690 RepID=A0A8H7CVY3_9AGAR|nr:p-loop containing nucleoside triphosphate hydrolase protein [Mycena venus]
MGTLLEIKHVDKIRLPDSGEWIIQNASDSEIGHKTRDDDKYAEWAEYAFIVRRSGLLRSAVREAMKAVEGVSWNGPVLKLDLQLLLAFLPHLRAASNICDPPASSDSNKGVTNEHLTFLIGFLESEYASTLQKIRTLVEYAETTFDLIWAIFVPGEMIFARCKTTGEPRAFRLKRIQKERRWPTNKIDWDLTCEYVDAADPSATGQQFGRVSHSITIENFDGIQKITDLVAYPFKYHPSAADISQKLIHRGREWANLRGVHHKQYNGLAYRNSEDVLGYRKLEGVRVDGRIMIDGDTFAIVEPNYSRPCPRKGVFGELLDAMEDKRSELKRSHPGSFDVEDIRDEDLLLATPIVYGFSFTQKRWFEFNVKCVSDIQWSEEGFDNLAIDPDRKILIKGLVKSHASLREKRPVDDFVAGKGSGLIINLFGPPGVGKTLTVEATSEHLRRPLYVVSAGDLGTTSTHLDEALTKIFSLVPKWDAVVLIDEADVFLEERGTADIERNAMVAVFLRQLEYFQGILFLTTNRVKQFDAAFQSRIHLSLRYNDLAQAEKEQLWRAFLQKTRSAGVSMCEFSAQQLQTLSLKNLNGREIKNIVNLSVALAAENKEDLTYGHIVRTMNITDDWGSHGPST